MNRFSTIILKNCTSNFWSSFGFRCSPGPILFFSCSAASKFQIVLEHPWWFQQGLYLFTFLQWSWGSIASGTLIHLHHWELMAFCNPPPAGIMVMPPANNVCLFRQMGELGWAAAWYQAVTKTKHTSWHGSLTCASGSLLPTGDVFLCVHSIKAVYAAHPWVQVCWMSKGPSWRGTCWQGETPPESIEVIGTNGLSPKCVCYIATCLLGRSKFLIVSQLLSLVLCHCRNTLAIQTMFCTKNIIL